MTYRAMKIVEHNTFEIYNNVCPVTYMFSMYNTDTRFTIMYVIVMYV